MYRLILFLMIASVSFAGSYQPNDIDKQIIQLSFNDKFDEAKDLSQRQINLNPDSPKYYYYKINAMVLEYFERITSIEIDKRDEERERINNEMISYVEEVIERFEDKELELEDKFYYGTILGYLARMQGLSGSWWGAFNTGSDARNIMEEILEADPKFYDTYLLLGMLEYYADRLSGVIGFVASVFGYSGDREKGLEYLNLALEKGTLAFGQTNLTLIEIYAQLEDDEYKALPYFEKFLERYPENKRIINGYVHELINTWNLDRADSIIVNDEKNLVNEYTRARYFDRIGNSEQAIKYASKVIDNSSRNWRG
jgi:tetratricopeptide (TPR) repeat protein